MKTELTLLPLQIFQDVTRLTYQLPNLVKSYEVPYPGWNHLDFLYGIDAKTLVYEELFKNLEKKISRFVPNVPAGVDSAAVLI